MSLLNTVTIIICTLTCLALFFHMKDSPVLSRDCKGWFTLLLLGITLGNLLYGCDLLYAALEPTPKVRLALTCLLLCLYPWLPILLGNALDLKRYTQFITMVVFLHTILELVFLPFRAIIYIDEQGQIVLGEYSFLFVLFYTFSLLDLLYLIFLLSKRFHHQKGWTLILATAVLLAGLLPPIFDEQCKSSFTGLTLCTLMVYMYYEEQLSQKKALAQEEHAKRLLTMQHQMILGVMGLIEHREDNRGTHAKNISSHIKGFAQAIQKEGLYQKVLDDHFIELLASVAPLYDVGKIKLPESLLKKPAQLTREEFEQVKTHTGEGGEFLLTTLSSVSDYESMKIAVDLATYHHEWWNGEGYPLGLRGEEIPLSARIMAFTDVYEALIQEKPYRGAYCPEDALQLISSESGTHFDPRLTPIFLRYVREKILTGMEVEGF